MDDRPVCAFETGPVSVTFDEASGRFLRCRVTVPLRVWRLNPPPPKDPPPPKERDNG